MKRFSIAFLLCLFLPLTVLTDELWSEEYYRAVDSTGELTEAEKIDLDETWLEFMQNIGSILRCLIPQRSGMTVRTLPRWRAIITRTVATARRVTDASDLSAWYPADIFDFFLQTASAYVTVISEYRKG